MVLERILVELPRWELADQWVHTVLDIEHGFFVAREKKALEKRTAVVGAVRVVAEGRGWKLVLVTD